MIQPEVRWIGVVGGGTMGAGIAQVALQAGYSVILFDLQEEVLKRAASGIQQKIDRLVEKGKLEADHASVILSRLTTTQDIAQMAAAEVVIEAVPEKLHIKQDIFRQLEAVCAPNTILATNTSSLSITVIAAQLKEPRRMIGMHFFNPAPVMKLVEVVKGDDTAEDIVNRVVELAKAFGKQPIVCKDTPGFIVNRVARNFYGEALRIVGEGAAESSVVDQLMEQAAGFRMGPFALMDLIGIDVNFDVTTAVYHAYHEEPRYRPHVLQERMVAAGRLGRKTGRGFYRHDPEESTDIAATQEQTRESQAFTGKVVVVGDTPQAAALAEALAEDALPDQSEVGVIYPGALQHWDTVGMKWRADEVEAELRRRRPDIVVVSLAGDEPYHCLLLQAVERGIRKDTLIMTSLAGPSATEQASWLRHPERVRGFYAHTAAALKLPEEPALEWSIPLQAAAGHADMRSRLNDMTTALAIRLGYTPVLIRDGAGGVTMRIVSMIFNEAAEVVREGVARSEDVDVGMRLGTNYPFGPVKWMDDMGIPAVWQTLSAMWREFGDDRYRPSPLLRQMVLAGFHGTHHGGGWYSLEKEHSALNMKAVKTQVSS